MDGRPGLLRGVREAAGPILLATANLIMAIVLLFDLAPSARVWAALVGVGGCIPGFLIGYWIVRRHEDDETSGKNLTWIVAPIGFALWAILNRYHPGLLVALMFTGSGLVYGIAYALVRRLDSAEVTSPKESN